VRRLIINADDFGMTRGINRAVVEASQQGIVSSTTLMATARAFDDAVAIAAQLSPQVSVGCHVILLDGTPVSPAPRVASLLQPGNQNGASEFRIKLSDFARAALMGKLDPGEIQTETEAQIDRVQQAGIVPSHIDCHKHAHMFPTVLRPLLRAAQRCKVRRIRNPFGRLFPVSFGRMARDPNLWRRVAELGLLRTFAGRFRKEVDAHGLLTTDGSVGVINTDNLDLGSFLQVVDALPEGTWEFVCHPGYNDAELDQVRTRLRQSRETELAVLTSHDAKAALQKRGIELVSYHDL
jgi:predicted glycoside hydrolase/deacetylase ChbG (UPF0249 family)